MMYAVGVHDIMKYSLALVFSLVSTSHHDWTPTSNMVQGTHEREDQGQGIFHDTMDTNGVHHHLRTLPWKNPIIVQGHRIPDQWHQQNHFLCGSNVCQKTFQRRIYDKVRDDPDQRERWSVKDSHVLHYPLRYAESVLRRPRCRKRIQECGQNHPHRPGDVGWTRLHKTKQR